MTREQLEQFSKDELIEIILQLQQRVAKLEEQLRGLTGPPKVGTVKLGKVLVSEKLPTIPG